MLGSEAPAADTPRVKMQLQLAINAVAGLKNRRILAGIAACKGRGEDFFGTFADELVFASSSATICESLIDSDVAASLVFDEENHVWQGIKECLWQQDSLPEVFEETVTEGVVWRGGAAWHRENFVRILSGQVELRQDPSLWGGIEIATMSQLYPKWTGVFPAVTTQMNQDQSLDLSATARHFEVLIESGVSGLIVCGSLGENQTLQPEEKRAVVECAVKTSAGRVPVLSGVAEMSTKAAISYLDDCEKLGAAGFMIMPAMVYKADQAEVMHWFRTLAAATPLPWMLYNNPVGYTIDVTPEMFAELADVGNLMAIKESSANPRRITELRNLVGDRYQLFTGVDDLILECSILGIDGWVAGSGIAFPEENQRLWRLTREGRWDEARDLYRWAQPLMKLDTHVHFVQYIKLLCQETGLGQEWVREPRLPIAGGERDQVLKIIREAWARKP